MHCEMLEVQKRVILCMPFPDVRQKILMLFQGRCYWAGRVGICPPSFSRNEKAKNIWNFAHFIYCTNKGLLHNLFKKFEILPTQFLQDCTAPVIYHMSEKVLTLRLLWPCSVWIQIFLRIMMRCLFERIGNVKFLTLHNSLIWNRCLWGCSNEGM